MYQQLHIGLHSIHKIYAYEGNKRVDRKKKKGINGNISKVKLYLISFQNKYI